MTSPHSDGLAVEGRLFAAGSSSCQPARLALQGDGMLCLQAGDTSTMLPAGELDWSSRLGDTDRRAELPDGRVFETSNNDGVDAVLRAACGQKASRLHRLERMRPGLLVLCAVALVTLLVSLRWALPWAADVSARFVPHGIEAQIGDKVMASLDRFALEPSRTPALTRDTVRSAFEQLAAHSIAPAGTLSLVFRDGGSIGANAMALPGGRVVVTDQLLALAGDPSLVAGVLAHEIAHVEARHSIRNLARAAGISVIVLLLTGDATGMLNDAALMGGAFVQLAYSRDFEREADRRAVELLRQSGHDPRSLAVLLQRLAAEHDGHEMPAWLSSHPPTEERTRLLENAAR